MPLADQGRNVRVGLAQIEIELGNRAKNQNTVKKWMDAHCKSSDVTTAITLPELWDVGYALDSVPELADPEGEIAHEFLSEMAKEYGVWFVGGSVMVSDGGKYFNRSQAINPMGELVAEYNKVHLVPFITKEDDVLLQETALVYLTLAVQERGVSSVMT